MVKAKISWSSFALFLAVALNCLLFTTTAKATNWQPHYMGHDPNNPNEQKLVAYVWTYGIPDWFVVPGLRNFKMVKECETYQIPYPLGASDVHIIIGREVGDKKCNIGQAAVVPDSQNGGYCFADMDDWYTDNFSLGEEMYVPWLDTDDVDSDFFLAIDIEAWRLADEVDYTANQEFQFVDGICDQLPGYFASDVATQFDTITGQFYSSSPYTGMAQVIGEAGTCPEPSSIFMLMVLSNAAILLYRRKKSCEVR